LRSGFQAELARKLIRTTAAARNQALASSKNAVNASPAALSTTPQPGAAAPVLPASTPTIAASAPPVAAPVRSGLAALSTPVIVPQNGTVEAGPAPEATQPPTPESMFGENPFMENPQGQFTDAYTGELRTYGFRSMYFATDSAAEKIAQQLGGTVVKRDAILGGGFFTQVQPNNMILLPNGREINAGFIAHFYTHGYPQNYIDRLIANEVDPDAGYGNLTVPVTIVRNGVVQPGAYPGTVKS
jgi:hypothetical protein